MLKNKKTSTQNNKIKLAVVDDHYLFRQGLMSLLESVDDMEIIIEASNGKEIIEALKSKKPDVILLDIQMPVMNGLEACEIIRKKYPDIKIIVLTMYDEEGMILQAIHRGAHGFLAKGTDVDKVIEGIYAVAETGNYFDEKTQKALLNGLQHKKKRILQNMT